MKISIKAYKMKNTINDITYTKEILKNKIKLSGFDIPSKMKHGCLSSSNLTELCVILISQTAGFLI